MMKDICKLFRIAVFTLLWPTILLAAPANPAGKGPFPDIELPNRVQGEQAIALLGNKLPELAAWYGMTTSEFAKLLRTDLTAWLDSKGHLVYIDNFPEPAAGEQEGPAAAAPFPLGETFTLHSRPGANRVIYLDFDGHTTSGTAWNASSGVDPIVSPPYNREGDPSTFTNLELEYIQKMWQQVAEDYAPFDVDVTTEDPGQAAITRSSTSDDNYGTRIVMTVDNFDNCGCGGFAYVGVFDYVGDYYKPAFVFNTSLVGAGEAISHEAGHNLGLSHDGVIGGTSYYQGHGSGETGWAPIMGVGYYKQLVQWSKGEYADANQTQDDIAIIQLNGAPMMADDHMDTQAGATPLTSVSNGTTVALTGSGLIMEQTDIDAFSFLAAAGSFQININPAPFSPNLDLLARLFDSNNNLIASNNPSESLPASLSGTLPASGEYILKVDGIGKGDPLGTGYTDYGSLGEYTINGTAPDPGGLQAPIALASASYTPGYAPVSVSFDGTGSTDNDGTITAYDWDFGDGNTGSGSTANYTYNAPGDYIARLTVTDNDGLTSNDTVNISVLNQAPVALVSSDITEGTAPASVQFTGSNSYDPDASGSIVSYQWDFGDGNTSNQADPAHTYTGAGDYVATLTVTDNLGDTDDTQTANIHVTPPPVSDYFAISENTAAGTRNGTFNDTFADDAVIETITERESGGRKSNRYSYLEHSWVFTTQPGNAVTLFINAWQSSSSDGDTFNFSYSVNGGAYQALTTTTDVDTGLSQIMLDPSASGEIRIRVTDSDQSQGNRALDSLFIDALFIRVEKQSGGTVPATPSALSASAASSSQINLSWSDNSSDEYGFTIERSDDLGANWMAIDTTGANETSYQDSDLATSTRYDYRVFAFNGSGSSAYTPVVFATTDAGSTAALTVNGYKVRGVQHADLSWTELTDVNIYRDGVLIATVSGSDYTDNIGQKGGGNYDYQVCQQGGTSNCTNIATAVF